MTKPSITSTNHVLPFFRLDPRTDFERLCLWLVEAEGYEKVEHYGLAGNEQGRDVIGFKNTDLWYFQCKRLKKINSTSLKAEIEKIVTLSDEHPDLVPVGIVFIIPRPVSAQIRDVVRRYCQKKNMKCEFWAETELDHRVKKHPSIVKEFFNQEVGDNTAIIPIFGNFVCPIPQYFVGRLDEINALTNALKTSNTIFIGGLPGIGKTYFVANYIGHAKLEAQTLWIDCNMSARIEQILARLAEFLVSSFKDDTLVSALRSVNLDDLRKREIAVGQVEKHKIVIVLDSCKAEHLHTLMPLLLLFNQALTTGRVLITTQEQYEAMAFTNTPSYLFLGKLTLEDGITLLKHHLDLLSITNVERDLLIDAYNKVDGHTYFLRLLASLAEQFPLVELLNDLPTIPSKAQHYLENHVFNYLSEKALSLLKNISILRVPFRVAAITSLSDDVNHHAAFEELLKKFLVMRQTRTGNLYDIHDLVRKYLKSETKSDVLKELHFKAVSYYRLLSDTNLYDRFERAHHEIEADLLLDASQSYQYFLVGLQHGGFFDYVLEITSELLKDVRVAQLGRIYHMRGRTYRFKEMFDDALKEYKLAIKFAEDRKVLSLAKYEAASVLAKQNRGIDGEGLEQANTIYLELANDEDRQMQIMALNGLGWLQIRHDIQKALDYLNKALQLAEQEGIETHLADTYQSLGSAHLVNTDPLEALKYLELAAKLRTNLLDEYGDQTIESRYFLYSTLARAYAETNNFRKAVDYSKQCVEIDKKLKLEIRLAHSLYFLGRDLCQNKMYSKSESTLYQSLILVEQHSIQDGAKRAIYEWLTVALWHQKKYIAAVEKFLEYQRICVSEGIPTPHHHIFVGEDDVRSVELAHFSEKGLHILLLPRRYRFADLEKWKLQIIAKRPELNIVAPLYFQAPH